MQKKERYGIWSRREECHWTHFNAAVHLSVKSPIRPGDAVAGSPGFDAESVVDRHSQTLPAANVAFRGLHRDMPRGETEFAQARHQDHGRAGRRTSGDHAEPFRRIMRLNGQ